MFGRRFPSDGGLAALASADADRAALPLMLMLLSDELQPGNARHSRPPK
jgi:hypothetical protein